jgi:hypothetical protein
VRSRVLYGAQVWAEELSASRRSLTLVRRLHRVTAIRAIRGYRTVSYASATVLAASPPPLRATSPCIQRKIRGQASLAARRTRGDTLARRFRRNTEQYLETLAHAAGRRRPDKTTPGSTCRAPQLGGVEEPERSSTSVQDDPNSYGARGIWGIPDTYREGDDVYLSPLSDRGRLGAAYIDVLPGVGRIQENAADRSG